MTPEEELSKAKEDLYALQTRVHELESIVHESWDRERAIAIKAMSIFSMKYGFRHGMNDTTWHRSFGLTETNHMIRIDLDDEGDLNLKGWFGIQTAYYCPREGCDVENELTYEERVIVCQDDTSEGIVSELEQACNTILNQMIEGATRLADHIQYHISKLPTTITLHEEGR